MQPHPSYLTRLIRSMTGQRSPFVLCYHGVSATPPTRDPRGLFVTAEQFDSHIAYIQRRGYELVTASELWRRMSTGADVKNVASITFDDGFVRAMHEAIPILIRRNAACSMFIPTGLLGRAHPHMAEERIMSREEVLELSAQGMEIGSHTVDHPHLPELSFQDARQQLHASRSFLEDLLGKPVTSLAYPFGAFNQQTICAARESGYEIAFGCSGPAPWDPLSLPREPVFPSITQLRLRLKMDGLFGPVHASLGARQRYHAIRSALRLR